MLVLNPIVSLLENNYQSLILKMRAMGFSALDAANLQWRNAQVR